MPQKKRNASALRSKDSLTSCRQVQQATEPDVRELFETSATLGELLKSYYAIKLRRAVPGQAAAIWEAILKDFLRYFEPWPDWVLKMAAEVAGVYAPTIPKTRLYAYFKFIHKFFVELRLDGTTPQELVSPPGIDANILGAAVGHGTVLQQMVEQQAVRLGKAGAISNEKLLEMRKKLMPPDTLKKALSRYIDVRSITDFTALSEGLAKAKARTLDKQGRFRITTATEVYCAILSNWPKVESMTGPTELCKFLNATLVGGRNDPAVKLDRTKKICRRMGIKFKGRRGTNPRPVLSL